MDAYRGHNIHKNWSIYIDPVVCTLSPWVLGVKCPPLIIVFSWKKIVGTMKWTLLFHIVYEISNKGLISHEVLRHEYRILFFLKLWLLDKFSVWHVRCGARRRQLHLDPLPPQIDTILEAKYYVRIKMAPTTQNGLITLSRRVTHRCVVGNLDLLKTSLCM